MLADISSYGIALIAVQASMDPTFTGSGAGPFDCGQTEAARQRLASKSTFGLHRVEVLGSLGSILIIYVPYISPTSPLHLPYISPTSPVYLARDGDELELVAGQREACRVYGRRVRA